MIDRIFKAAKRLKNLRELNSLENFFWIGFVGSVIALLFAVIQGRKVLSFSEGTPVMQKIASAIRKGANAYLKRQYKTVAIFL